MSNDELTNLTRRKVLGTLGVVGAGAALGGAGTAAFFSDTETFENNSIVAGSLDLTVDWEEHYADMIGAETAYAERGTPEDFDYLLPGQPDDPFQRPIRLKFTGGTDTQDSKDLFWDATAIEALPDTESQEGSDLQGNGQQDSLDGYNPCEDFVDVGPNANGLASSLRTNNTIDGHTTEPGDSLVNLQDVKPGDFGEVTFSFHLCDNDGYVWLNGGLSSASENGVTEPEADDPDEQDGVVELLDRVETRFWYDDKCDNQVVASDRKLDLMIAIDASGSIDGDAGTQGTEAYQLVQGVQQFIDEVQTMPIDVQIGSLTFGEKTTDHPNGDVTRLQGLQDPTNFGITYPASGNRGNTPMPPALDIAEQELYDGANARPDAEKTLVVFTDGGPNYPDGSEYNVGSYHAPNAAGQAPEHYSADPTTAGYDNGNQDSTVSEGEMSETAGVADAVRDLGSPVRIATVYVGDDPTAHMSGNATSQYTDLPTYLAEEIADPGFAYNVALTDLQDLSTNLVGQITAGQDVFFQGTLREALTALEAHDGRGIPLDGDTGTGYDELNDPEADPGRDCFPGQSTHCIGFEWWLPIDHANEVQTDTVSFDIGFYGEQCRHNDGGGMTTEANSTSG